jgi:threonine synthase
VKVAREHLVSGVPMIVLETALPAKFAASIEEAVGFAPPVPAALADLETRPRRSVDMPADAAAIKAYLASHVPEAHGA